MVEMKKPAEILDALTHEAELHEKLDNLFIRCLACAHRCRIAPGKRGICQMRVNKDGILYAPWGYIAGAAIDPVEKKPFSHFLPGASALTFGMLGCNMRCDFCQNWLSSQTLREPAANDVISSIQKVSPEQIVQAAVHGRVEIIASSYNEPLITCEWAREIFRLANEQGIACAYVSNGFATPEALEYLRPVLSGFKVDLKTMQEKQYKELGGGLQPVLDTIIKAHTMGLWVEVVTLIIPGFNDSPEELWDAARFLVSVSADIPWHVTAYHPDYNHDAPATTPDLLQRAADVGQEAGLRYVYAGNLPGRVGSLEDTHCPHCSMVLVKRRGYTIHEYHVSADGKCSRCGEKIAGVWTDKPEQVNIGGWGMPRRV